MEALTHNDRIGFLEDLKSFMDNYDVTIGLSYKGITPEIAVMYDEGFFVFPASGFNKPHVEAEIERINKGPKAEVKPTLEELKEQAEELISGGNSREKAEGWGMLKVLNTLKI